MCEFFWRSGCRSSPTILRFTNCALQHTSHPRECTAGSSERSETYRLLSGTCSYACRRNKNIISFSVCRFLSDRSKQRLWKSENTDFESESFLNYHCLCARSQSFISLHCEMHLNYTKESRYECVREIILGVTRLLFQKLSSSGLLLKNTWYSSFGFSNTDFAKSHRTWITLVWQGQSGVPY